MDSKAELVAAAGRVVAGLCLCGVAVWAAVEAVSADAAVGGPIVVAVIGLLGAVFERSRVEYERRREVQRERMEPMYKAFVERAHDRFRSGGQSMPAEAREFFTTLKGKEFLLGANDEVIHSLIAFEKTEPTDKKPLAPALAYEALLRAIRSDLGHKDRKLQEGDLLKLFSNYQ